MRSMLFVLRKPPHSSLATREAIDAALASAAFGAEIALLFQDDGVFQIRAGQQPDTAGLKRTAPMFESLELYGVDQIYVCRDSLAVRNLTPADLIIPVQMLDCTGIREQLARFDHLLTF